MRYISIFLAIVSLSGCWWDENTDLETPVMCGVRLAFYGDETQNFGVRYHTLEIHNTVDNQKRVTIKKLFIQHDGDPLDDPTGDIYVDGRTVWNHSSSFVHDLYIPKGDTVLVEVENAIGALDYVMCNCFVTRI